MIKAVVFDIDGTLVDTSEFIFQAYEHTLAAYNFPARSRADIASQIGRKIEECYAFLAPGGDFPDLIKTHGEFQSQNVDLVQPFKNAVSMIDQLKSAGLKICLWTGRRHYVPQSLEAAGLRPDVFDCIVDGGMITKGKPDPEGFLVALKQLKTTANETIMVGDAGLDMAAAKAAGANAVIGITHGFGTKEELERAEADYIVDSLKDVKTTIFRIMEAS
jgi:phosphoglycolate phosphatase-like HAD superfamily hydrolase